MKDLNFTDIEDYFFLKLLFRKIVAKYWFEWYPNLDFGGS